MLNNILKTKKKVKLKEKKSNIIRRMTYSLYILLFQNHASNFRNHCEFKMKNARITKYFKSEGKKKQL